MRLGLFPGQGVPVRTVLAALPENHPTVDKASEVLGFDLRKRVEQVAKRERSIMPTSLAQPAIFTASVLAWQELSHEQFDCYLGHSVGEYAALVAGGSMTFDQALCVVQVRGAAMEKAALEANGGMAAVIDLTLDEAEAIAEATGTIVANDNSPQQVVLAGSDEALVEAASQTRARGGRAVRLDVTGPFHTPQVVAAAPLLRDALEHISIRSPRVPVISNVSAAAYRAPGEIRKLLLDQLTSRVRFREALENLWLNGVNDFHDFGPAKIVGSLASRTFDSLQLNPANVG
jgi:[acyl-carrier-protein] S-malonyltransferase